MIIFWQQDTHVFDRTLLREVFVGEDAYLMPYVIWLLMVLTRYL